MKLKRLSLLLLAVFMISLLPVSVYAAVQNPFEPIHALNYDSSNDPAKFVKQTAKGYVAFNGRNHGLYVCFKDVNFEYAPYSVTVSNGVSSGYLSNNTFQFRIDSPDSDPIATVYVNECIDWEAPNETTGTVTKKVTGVHDLYVSSSQPDNLYNFYFTGNDPNEIIYRPYENDSVFADMVGNSAERQVNALYGLEIAEEYENGKFVPEMPMTRADFAVWVSRLMTEEVPKAENCPFTDIESTDNGYNEICYLYDNGLVSLNEEGKYNPWKFITVRDAYVMLLRMMGYDYLCTYKGGYPYGYDAVARDLGIVGKLAPQDYLRRGDGAKLIYSTFDAEYVDVSGIKNDTLSYTKKSDGILYKKRGIVKSEGVVTSTVFGSLLSGNTETNGYCTIDSVRYAVGETKVNDYLGVSCEIYYKENDGGIRELIYVGPSKRTEQLIISGNEYDFSKITENEIVYGKEDGKSKTVKIPTKAIWVYNNSPLDVPVSQVVNANNFQGRIRLVDNGKGYETVIVEEYRNIVIKTIDEEKQIIYDELTNAEVDTAIRNAKIIASDGQNSVRLKKVARGTLAEMYLSYDKERCILIFKENVITGSATEVNSAGKVIVNNSEYYLAKECNDTIIPGVTTEFHINRHNEIVYAKSDDQTKAVALLYDVKKVDKKLVFCLLTDTNTVSEFESAQKVWVDGVRYKELEDIRLAVPQTAQLKPVLYKLDAEGKVTMIDTPEKSAQNEYDTLTALNPSNYTDGYLYYYRKGLGAFSLQNNTNHILSYVADSNASIFIQSEKETDKTKCRVAKLSNFSSCSEGEQFVFYCSKTGTQIADILHCASFAYQSRTDYMVLDSVTTAVNEDGNIGLKLNLVKNGSSTSYWLSEDDTAVCNQVKILKKGDIIHVYLDQNKNVYSISVGCFIDGVQKRTVGNVSLSATMHSNNGKSGNLSNPPLWLYGTVSEIEDEYVNIAPFGGIQNSWCKIGTADVMRLSSDGKITNTTGISIKPGDKILVSASGSYQMIVVYD